MVMSLSAGLFWRGLLAIVVGIIAVAWPGITIGAFVILFAVYAFMAAGGDLLQAFSSRKAGSVLGWLVLAALSVIAGVVALAWPGITALAITVWVAVWGLTVGFIELAMAFQRGDTAGERAMWGLTGLVSIALSAVLFIRPDIGAVSLASVFGLFALVWGVTGVVLSFQTRAVSGSHLVDRVGSVV
jgi:uncharacterized membrane protein HdeD (DUF308 family)